MSFLLDFFVKSKRRLGAGKDYADDSMFKENHTYFVTFFVKGSVIFPT